MLNGSVEPLLAMISSSNRLTSHNDSNTNSNGSSSRRSAMKGSALARLSALNTSHSTVNNDNRIKFVDMLVCGSCQQDFQLSDIVKFIEHKASCGNKENRRKIPYFLSQRPAREGDNDDEDDEDDDEEGKSQHGDNCSGSETENHFHSRHLNEKQSSLSKVLVDASANTLNSTSNYLLTVNFVI
jgi:TATA-binding protein-associated factor Taf7